MTVLNINGSRCSDNNVPAVIYADFEELRTDLAD
jgi:hypothetical protein